MKIVLLKNKIFLTVAIGVLVIGGIICFSESEDENKLGKIEETISLAGNCENIPGLSNGVSKLVTKVIDGDTFLIEGGYSVRILGIDADEREHPCYYQAKNRLEELILNKKVKLEKGTEDKDQWCRYLRYVFLDSENIGLKLVQEGLAVARFSPEDVKYRKEIIEAENTAKESKVGCKWIEEKTKFEWEKLTESLSGLKVIGACQSVNYLNQEVIIEGKIIRAYRSKTNTIFLNFGKSYPNQCFSAVIFKSAQHKFLGKPESFYTYKTVRIRGQVKEYQGKPEIILEDPSQIETGK